MPVHLRKIMSECGATSVRDLIQKTGSSEKSVYRQGQIAEIDLLYLKNMGMRGPLGFPLGEVEFVGSTASRQYAGGPIKFLDGPQGPLETWVVDVRFAGFMCERESNWDQASGSDEPFFIIGLAGTNGSKTVKFGPYEKINSGTVRVEGGYVIEKKADGISPPILLGIVGMEHDFGNDEESEKKVRDAIKEVERKLDQAVAAFMGASSDNHVMPEWLRDILIGWGPEVAAKLLDLADDQIGKNTVWLFDYKPSGDWTQYPEKGSLDQQKYTHEIILDGGDDGIYKLYFHVKLAKETWVFPE